MSRPTDQDLENSVAAMLRFGVSLAALVVLAGGAMVLLHSVAAPDYQHFQSGDASLRTLRGILQGAFHLQGAEIIQLGLVLLIATPVARVVFCVVGFARQRDKLYVTVSAVVLVILIYALTKGGR
jgi:uncharacterized membrane protein